MRRVSLPRMSTRGDKGGALVERYPDGDDHSIDAVAYGNREHIYRSRRTSNVSRKGARR